jgi:nitroreductase
LAAVRTAGRVGGLSRFRVTAILGLLWNADSSLIGGMNTHVEEQLGLIFGRRSIRAYTGVKVSDQAIQKILEAAMAAPSAVGKDPWRFVVLRSPEIIERLAPILSNGEMLLQAGTGIAVCGDIEAAHDGQLSYLLQDCSAAIENMLLCAHILGLGACWLGVHPREARLQSVRELLRLPSTVIPVSCVCVGHPRESKPPRTRFNPEFVHLDTWQQKRSS